MSDKYQETAKAVRGCGARSVLDVGCRGGELGKALHCDGGAPIRYTGVDLYPGEAVSLVADVTKGIPVEDGTYDAVAALDVLEHLDDLQGGLDELVRVGRRRVVVVLPNLAHVRHRLSFLVKGRLATGKYDLVLDAPQDRHRWLTVVPQTDDFIAAYARRAGLELSRLDLSAGPRTAHLERLLEGLRFSRSWRTWAVLYTLTKPVR